MAAAHLYASRLKLRLLSVNESVKIPLCDGPGLPRLPSGAASMLRSILAASTLRALLAWNASSAVPVRFRCDGSALLGLWTFDGKAAAVRRAGILETWWSPGCTCWLSATPLAGVEDVVVTGGPSTYFGTAYRGFVGLGLVRRRYPGRRWYGILGDDNYVHWPSLFAGLRRLDGRARAGAFPLPVAAGEVGDEAGARRFFGGAGIFTNAEMTDALAPHLEGLAASVVARANASNFEKRSLLHDVLVSSFLRETLELPAAVARTGPRSGPDLLTHADFLYSSEPAFYICARARLARTWLKHAPAVFHKFRSRRHLRRVHVVATTGAPSDEARAADAEGVMVRGRSMEDVRCSFLTVARALCAAWHDCRRAPAKAAPPRAPPAAAPAPAPRPPRLEPEPQRRKRLPGTPGDGRPPPASRGGQNPLVYGGRRRKKLPF